MTTVRVLCIKGTMLEFVIPQYHCQEMCKLQEGLHGVIGQSELFGASTVAIDNKIEQAMDLVKSHLMFAVREEVEVLKVQIKELIEKNTHLEQENNILKANASPETMAILNQQLTTQQQPPPSSAS